MYTYEVVVVCAFFDEIIDFRLERASGKKEMMIYIRNVRKRIVHQAAAKAWVLGVPWAEALSMAQRAVDAGDAVAPNPFNRKGKGKGRGKGKGKGR